MEFAAADPPELRDILANLQVEAVAYLDDNFEVLARPDVTHFSRTERQGDTLFLRGDANSDGELDVTDVLITLQYVILYGDPPKCLKAVDAADDGRLNLTDAVRVVLHLFRGRELPPPYPRCGADPTPDDLNCEPVAACE